jgi:hypothetical protein
VIAALDIDITFKLHALRLFEEAIDALGVDGAIRVLAQAKFSNGSRMPAKRRHNRVEKYGEEAVAAAAAIFDDAVEVDPGSAEAMDVLAGIDGIDDGEAALIAAAMSQDAIVLVTGDKRCLSALSTNPKLADVRRALLGRIVCLESLILKLIDDCGFEYVRDRVVPNMRCDTAVRAAFGSGLDARQANVVAALTAALPSDRELLRPL